MSINITQPNKSKMNRDQEIADLRKERDRLKKEIAERKKEKERLISEYQQKIQERSNCSPDQVHPNKRSCSQLPCGCKHPEFYWIEENGDECCYYCRKGTYCECPEDEDSDDE